MIDYEQIRQVEEFQQIAAANQDLGHRLVTSEIIISSYNGDSFFRASIGRRKGLSVITPIENQFYILWKPTDTKIVGFELEEPKTLKLDDEFRFIATNLETLSYLSLEDEARRTLSAHSIHQTLMDLLSPKKNP